MGAGIGVDENRDANIGRGQSLYHHAELGPGRIRRPSALAGDLTFAHRNQRALMG